MDELKTSGENKTFANLLKNSQHFIDKVVIVLHSFKEGKEIFGGGSITAKDGIEIVSRLNGVALSLIHLWKDDPVSVIVAIWNFFLLVQMILKLTVKLVSKIKFGKLISYFKSTKIT